MAVAVVAPLSVLVLLHGATAVAYHHPADPAEVLVFTQNSTDVLPVRDTILQLERRATIGGDGHANVLVDDWGGTSWPWAWYFRDQPIRYASMDRPVPPEGADAVIVEPTAAPGLCRLPLPLTRMVGGRLRRAASGLAVALVPPPRGVEREGVAESVSVRAQGRGRAGRVVAVAGARVIRTHDTGRRRIMNRRVAVVAPLAAAAVLIATAVADARPDRGPPPGVHGALRLEMLSGPAQYVSGGAARVRVVVPASVPLADAVVELNGADVTSAFGPDDQVSHALEGVVTGLPLGASTLRASVPAPATRRSTARR